MNATALQPFLTTALPIMFAILVAAWMNSKGFDRIESRLERIETKLDNHETRIVRLEERTSPLTGVR